MILVFDTETTGKANFKAPLQHPSQPRIVQIGAQLLDADYKVRGELNLIVKPLGFSIPKEASNVHGITTEIAESCGIGLHLALESFEAFASAAKVIVAHNLNFDTLVINSESIKANKGSLFRREHIMFCTMEATTNLCKMPGNYGDYKWPKLQEAYLHAFGETFEGAHDAMADVRACARIYKWLMAKSKPEEVK